MASYYESYDSRPRLSPRHASFTRGSRDDGTYLNPTAGQPSRSPRRVSDDEGRSSRTNKEPRSTTRTRSRHEPRDHYPPPLPPNTGRPGPPRSPNRKRYSWPPGPICEDERASLAKEAGSQKILSRLRKDDAVSRGSIDQEPVLQYTPEYAEQFELRPVASKNTRKNEPSSGMPTPPSSEDEKFSKARPQSSRSNILDEGMPLNLNRRTAAPYSYSKPTKLSKGFSLGEQVLSPGLLSPLTFDSRHAQLGSASAPTSPNREPRRGSPSARKGSDYFSAGYSRDENAVEDTDWDTSDSASSRQRKPPRSPMKSDTGNSSPRTSTQDFAPPPSSSMPTRRANLDARRNTDTANTLPSFQKPRSDKNRRPTPLMASSALSELTDVSHYPSSPATLKPEDMQLPRSRDASDTSSRAVSPASTNGRPEISPSPSHSPKPGYDASREKSLGTSPASKTSSVSNSRPPSPRSSVDNTRIPRTDLDWNALMSANNTRRPMQPSRLASSMRQDSMPEVPRANYTPPHSNQTSDDRPSSSSGGLPYPQDDGPYIPSVMMPLEDQYFAPVPSLSKPFTYDPKLAPRGESSTTASARPSTQPPKPPLVSRNSATTTFSTETRTRPAEPRYTSTSSAETKKELSALLKKGLPECPRPKPVSGYDDWYTVIGAPNVEFCPDCVQSVFERTVFRPSIRRTPTRSLKTKVQCAFGSSAWMRFAWRHTLKQQRTDLTLLKDFADIEDSGESCPGGQEAARPWYGLRDPDGLFVRDFHICYSDVRKIERIFPSLAGVFVRLPYRAAYDKQICATRTDGNRFSTYLDTLRSTHDKSITSRKAADPMPFIALVERKSRLRDCTRDNMLLGGLWHFPPNMPSLTVCEDCYDTVIEPEVRRKSDVALRFNRTIQPVYGEGMGSSCQLYSKRMRKVFDRAVQADDLKYLARKTAERRDAELRLQDRYKSVMRRARRVSRDGEYSEDDERRLDRELERITSEWVTKWE